LDGEEDTLPEALGETEAEGDRDKEVKPSSVNA
jgi:hypothetical protein